MSVRSAADHSSSSGAQASDRRATSWSRLLPTVTVALLAGLVYLAASGSLIDDAYITLSYAKQFGLHLHWGLAPGEVANTATSPLPVLLLSLLIAIVRDGVVALGILVVLCAVGTEYGLRRCARAVGIPWWLGLLATVLCLFNPLVLSTIGMAVLLAIALAVALLVAAVEGRPWAFGVIAGLLVLVRMDLVLVVGALFLLRRRWWVGWYKSVSVALLIAASWLVTSWFLLGSAVPDTFVIKTGQGSWGEFTFANGALLYFNSFPIATVLTIVPVAAGAIIALCWALRRAFGGSAAGGRLNALVGLPVAAAAHFGAYAILVVPPYHWYYGPTVVLMTVYVAAALTIWISRCQRVPARAVAALPVAALLVAFVGGYVSAGLPREYVPIQTNHASAAQYREIARDLDEIVGDSAVAAGLEIGTLAYYCSCRLYGDFSDRGYFAGLLEAYLKEASPLKRKLLAWNYRHFDRSTQPAPTEYTLYEAGEVPETAVAAWPIYSPWGGSGYVVLTRNE